MLEKLQARKHTLEHELQRATEAIADLERRHEATLATRLRIEGAIQVLNEMIAEAQVAAPQENNNA